MRIDLTMAELNGMIANTADIINAYIKAPSGENIYNILGPEFKPYEGKIEIIVRALYGLKSVGEFFQSHLAKCMQFMVYKTCLDDPGMWMRPMNKLSDNFEHYEYALIYVDDVLAIGDDTTEILQNIDKYFGLNPGSISDPNIYLVANMKTMRMENRIVAWYLRPLQYIQEAVKNTDQYVKENIGD